MIINQGEECLLVIANSKVRPRHSRCSWKVFIVAVHRKAFPNSASFSVAAQEFKSAVLLGCFHFRKFPHWPLHPKRASLDQSEASICQRDRARPIRWQDFRVKWAEGRSGWMLASCALAACPRRPPRSSDDRQHEEIKLSQNIWSIVIPSKVLHKSWWKDARYTNCKGHPIPWSTKKMTILLVDIVS